jgi:predicted Fe-Mo cluster-binding NifX family protein
MRIVITSLGETTESPMDERFDRARFFVLYDVESGEWSVHENAPGAGGASGTGTEAVRHVVGLGAGAVITGHCGPKALTALAAAGIDVYQEVSGSIRDAVDAYKAGLLKRE